MARPRSEFLGSLGKLFSLFKKVVDRVLLLGGNDENITRIDTDENLADQIARLIVEGDGASIAKIELIHRPYGTFEKVDGIVIKFYPSLYEISKDLGRFFYLGQMVWSQDLWAYPAGTPGFIVMLNENGDTSCQAIHVAFKGSIVPCKCSELRKAEQ